MFNSKVSISIFIFALPILLSASAHGASQGVTEIEIGFTPALSGSQILDGNSNLKAANLAIKTLNESGGIRGAKLKLIVEDNQSTEAGIKSAYEKILNEHKPLAIITSQKTVQCQALNEQIQKHAVPAIIAGTNPKLTEQGNPWVFRTRPDDEVTATAIVKYIKEDLKLSKIGIVHDADSFGTQGAELLEKYGKAEGLTFLKRVSYPSKERDFSAQLNAMKTAGVQIMIVYATNASDVGILQRQYRDSGATYAYIGSPTSQYRAALRISHGKSDGIFSAADFVDSKSRPATKKFVEDYKKEYKEDVDPGAVWVYDSVLLIHHALETGADTPVKVRDALHLTKNFEGAMGTYSFATNGNGLFQAHIVKVQAGEPVLQRTISLGH